MRLFPFYKFSSRMRPFTLEELANRPGGKLSQTLRATNRARDPDEMTPDYVAETAAVPVEGTPLEWLLGDPRQPGTKRYLTGFGLAFEDPLAFAGGGVRGAGLEALSRLNPVLAKPLLEYVTGQSFFQKGPLGGRSLEDLDPTIGRTLRNVQQMASGDHSYQEPVQTPLPMEMALSNLPVPPGPRFWTTLRQWTDFRKSIPSKLVNTATGFRVSDVSPGAQDAILRERAHQAMKSLGAKNFQRTYFKKEDLEKMSPDQQVEALRLQALMNVLARRAKQRAAEQ